MNSSILSPAPLDAATEPSRMTELEHVLERHGPRGQTVLLEVLHDAQSLFGGWLPEPVLRRISAYLRVPLSEIYGVTEFYDMFHTEPVGRKHIRVCVDGPCAVRGSDALMSEVSRHTGCAPGETTADGAVTLEPVRCLGLCDRAPAALVNGERYAPAAADDLFDGTPAPSQLKIGGLVKVALANVGVVDPTSLADYRAQGGMAALRKVLREMTPSQVISQVKASKLLGRGGAAFSAGLKWELAARHPQPAYMICNADESEPGAFKDRVLMDGDPFRVIEGLLIACYAIGAEHAFIYVRGEHRLGYERFTEAVRQLDEAGYLCGDDPGRPFACRIEVRRGAGAYVCGEETALMESIEGKRGFPRLRPPYPTDAGLWGRPTVINNVETLAKVPSIIMHGPVWYNALGTSESAGTKLFAVSGSVVRPGVYETPFGMPLRHLIFDLAGRVGRGAQHPGRADRGRGRHVPHRRAPRRAAHVRGLPQGGRHHRRGDDHGLRRHGRPARRAGAHRRVLRARELRQVLSVPDGHAAPGRDPGAARRRARVAPPMSRT